MHDHDHLVTGSGVGGSVSALRLAEEGWRDARRRRGFAEGRRSLVRTHRFSHHDQVIQAAVDGMGVAIGKMPHLARHLRDGVLVAPFGRDWGARPGHFAIVVADAARGRSDVAAFVTWLKKASGEDAKDALSGPACVGRPGVRLPLAVSASGKP